jgi:hypothetical protein
MYKINQQINKIIIMIMMMMMMMMMMMIKRKQLKQTTEFSNKLIFQNETH